MRLPEDPAAPSGPRQLLLFELSDQTSHTCSPEAPPPSLPPELDAPGQRRLGWTIPSDAADQRRASREARLYRHLVRQGVAPAAALARARRYIAFGDNACAWCAELLEDDLFVACPACLDALGIGGAL